MVTFTKQQVQDYERRNKASREVSRAEPQRPFCNEPLGPSETQKGSAGRISVRITSIRRRLLDPDNLCAKALLDCLRYVGLIPDDRPQDIRLITEQRQCKTKAEEVTEIIIEYP